jgi:hypothetical protein
MLVKPLGDVIFTRCSTAFVIDRFRIIIITLQFHASYCCLLIVLYCVMCPFSCFVASFVLHREYTPSYVLYARCSTVSSASEGTLHNVVCGGKRDVKSPAYQRVANQAVTDVWRDWLLTHGHGKNVFKCLQNYAENTNKDNYSNKVWPTQSPTLVAAV